MSEEGKDLYMYMDRGGKYFIGYVVEESVENHTVIMKQVLIIKEHVMPGQTPDQQQIMLNLSPIMHTFNIDMWEFQWIGRHKATDPKLVNAHEKFWSQIRAARSNIAVSSAVPPGLANSLDPAVARIAQG